MEKKLFDLLAAALTALTLLTAWGIWLDDRRKRRKDNVTSQSTVNSAQGLTNDEIREEVEGLRREIDTQRRRINKVFDAVRQHRIKIRELLEKLSDNTF